MSTFVKKATSAVLTSAIVLTTAGSTAGVNAALMGNIDAANFIANNGVIVDQSSNPSAYRLADTIQRKEALKVMIKLSDLTVSQGACVSPFADIKNTDWACKYAVAALNAGYIAANTNFRPDDKVSKIEALKMVMKARKIEKDANTSDWRAAYVKAAVAKGIAEEFTDYNTSATRGTMFVWAAEAIKKAANNTNVDNVTVENTNTEDTSTDIGDILGDILNGTDENTGTNENIADNNTNTDNSQTTDTSATADELTVSLNPETPSDGLAPADTDRTPLLKFDVKAGSQDVTLKELTLNFIGLGDYKNLDNVAVYNNIGERISKIRSFTDNERQISFNKNIVVEAGKTMTLTIAGKIATNGATNSTYGVKLVDLKASSDVKGSDLVGALLVPADFANTAKLSIDADRQTGKITVGETKTLVKFDVEETEDNEDVILKSITLHTTGTADSKDLSNLEAYVDGKKVDATIKVNDDDEIVMALNTTVPADKTVTVKVKGTVTGSVGDNIDFVFEGNDDIYAVGATSGLPVQISNDITTEDLSDVRTIEGSEINVSFEKSDKDETTVDTNDVKAGTLKMLALTNAYEIKELTVTVTATNVPTGFTGTGIKDMIENLKLGGTSEDVVTGDDTNTGTYTFKDISLSANEAKNLDLTFDTQKDPALNGTKLKFQVAITKVKDEDDNKTYTSTSTPNISTILSSTALDNKTIDIKQGTLEVINVDVNDKELVIGNGVETVLYKAKINVSDAENLTINDFELADDNSQLNGEDLDKVIDSATLNIGGKTFKGDVNSNSIDFDGIDDEIAANSNGVEVLVTAVLKDNDNVQDGDYIQVKLNTVNADNSKGKSLVEGTTLLTSAANSKPTKTILKSQGTFDFAILKNGNNKDEIKNVVLAGQNDVALGEFKIRADLEDTYVNELNLKAYDYGYGSRDYSDTLKNVRLVDDKGNTIASTDNIKFDGTNTVIKFEDFKVTKTDTDVEGTIVADIQKYTTEGDETSAELGNISFKAFTATDADVEGDISDNTITAGIISGNTESEIVKLVPVLVTATVEDRLGSNDKYGKIKFTIDRGNNKLDNNDITVNAIHIETASASGITVRNNNNETIVNDDKDTTLNVSAINNADVTISDGDVYEFKVNADNTEVRINKYGIDFTVDGNQYQSNNESVLDLGEYDAN